MRLFGLLDVGGNGHDHERCGLGGGVEEHPIGN